MHRGDQGSWITRSSPSFIYIQQPQPIWSRNSGHGDYPTLEGAPPRYPLPPPLLGLSLPQTPATTLSLAHRTPRAAPPGPTREHGACGQGQVEPVRQMESLWPAVRLQVITRPAWKLCSVNLTQAGEERVLPLSSLGLLSLWGQGAPCLGVKGMQPSSAAQESSPALRPWAPEPQGATWHFTGLSRA